MLVVDFKLGPRGGMVKIMSTTTRFSKHFTGTCLDSTSEMAGLSGDAP